MCKELSSKTATIMDLNNNKKLTYSLKKLLKQYFKQRKAEKLERFEKAGETYESLNSIETMQNNRNADIESECENMVNECRSEIFSSQLEDYELSDVISVPVPVHFMRTDQGTFFWTSAADIAADNDLAEPLYCYTTNQVAVNQVQDRWAQA
uniref:Enhancer of split m4 protein n=1 Tax=Glossina brevipalpis TaxID=37001 RepID=A0A1A9X2P0_9MUSC